MCIQLCMLSISVPCESAEFLLISECTFTVDLLIHFYSRDQTGQTQYRLVVCPISFGPHVDNAKDSLTLNSTLTLFSLMKVNRNTRLEKDIYKKKTIFLVL